MGSGSCWQSPRRSKTGRDALRYSMNPAAREPCENFSTISGRGLRPTAVRLSSAPNLISSWTSEQDTAISSGSGCIDDSGS
jgi:hypothetical protein